MMITSRKKHINFLLTLPLLLSMALGPMMATPAQPALAAAPQAPNAIVIDGVKEADWGTAVAMDPTGDMSESNLDLESLYMTHDADNFYIGLDAKASNWGMAYGIYIDTDMVPGSGATTDPWGRAVNAVTDHLPEFALYVWHKDNDTLEDAQLTTWSETTRGWSYPTLISLGGEQGYSGVNDWLEYKIPKAALGNALQISVEAFTTGGGGHAQDTVPSDPNVAYTDPDWGGDVTTLSAFNTYPPMPLELNITSPADGTMFPEADIDVTGTVSPTIGVTLTVELNETEIYTPVIDLTGAFSQPLTLVRGANQIDIKFTDGYFTLMSQRNVFFGAEQDDTIWEKDLAHDSRDLAYRTPFGAVTTGETVSLRLRSAAGDLTGVQMRLYNDRTNVEKMVDMTSVYDDGTYEWWQYDLVVGDDPTVYWYRFVVMDGTAMGYYEDDDERLGGLGELFDESQDNSWQLTVYDPAYATPDWIKEAVVYQIFTDRFRDGDPTNNTPAGSFFYEEATTINRSTGTAWNTPICDPRDDFGICPETYSQNFYGGDLQGIIDKLEYLDNLGVTVLYLNPIFESPSNHKYDTTDYSVIDDNYGDLYLFQTLVAEANARGIKVILDGVFNHTSSDSIYFDRYGRYDSIGACESPDSPYRDWYYFEDVEPGTGPCVGSDGTLEAADYESWWGYESLPKLKANSDEVRELIWDGGPDSIARYWVAPAQGAAGWRLDVGGDVDPGTINDPENDYWEGFREAVHLTNPDAYILGEEWGNASSWVLGGEWDGVMNYQYSTAMLGFWRDTDFTDNDHNANSSAGVIEPLTPTELDEHLLNWIERYPPEALYAMMNLLGSHDTNRPLFMLDHDAAEGTDDTLLNNPNYDWSDSVERLMGVVILQMTLPGAPTIYYGDEVGAVGPVTYDNGKWEDDPYNRVPYPWLDESGSPFYTFLRDYKNQTDLYNYYTLLIGARNEHPALSTGSFDTLLTDDDEKIYAYGRKLADNSDAAIVIINRNKSPNLGKNVTLDVSGYLPVGASFENVLDTPVSLNAYGDKYNVDANGEITIYVPPMDGVILVLDYPAAAPPATVTDLAVTAELSKALDLAWSAVVGADSYDVYRSRLNGGGYEMIDNVVGTTYNDTDLTNAVPYYYVVVARDDTTGLVSGYSNEAMGIPHYDLSVAYYELTAPDEITHTISTITPTEAISAQLWINDITGGAGPAEGIMFQIGYGFSSTLPADLTWVDMAYAAAVGDNDEFTGTLLPDYLGEYIYVVQVSSDGGRSWFYADLGGPGDNGQPGKLHVVPSDDLEAPAAPLNLELDRTTASSISFFWSANTEDDLAGYEIYRQHVEAALAAPQAFERIGRVESDTTDYKDSTVETGETYDYYVLAFDTSFNRSPESNILTATAEDRPVTVTLTVTVPAFTPGTVYFSREIDEVAHLAGDWDPAGVELNQVDETTWTTQLVLLDASETEFKFTRGNWETVEKEADGNTEINNRRLVVDYGDDGTQTVSYTVANWRDPIVVATDPVDDEFGVILNKIITVEWSQAMPPDTEFVVETVEGPVLGTYGYDDATFTSIFIPTGELEEGKTYTVTVAGLQDAGGDWQIVDVEFSFSTPFSAYFPLIFTGYIPEPFTP